MISPLVSIAHAAGAEGGSSGMPQFDATHFPSQILWLVAAIVVLHFLLSKVAIPRVNEIITTREQAITGDVERAEELHRTAEDLRARIADRNAVTLAETQRIAAESHAAVHREIEAEKAKAVTHISEQTRAGEQRVHALREAMSETSGQGSKESGATDQEHREAAAQIERIAWDVAAAVVEKIRGDNADTGVVMEAVRSRTRTG